MFNHLHQTITLAIIRNKPITKFKVKDVAEVYKNYFKQCPPKNLKQLCKGK